MSAQMTQPMHRTTVDLPEHLLERAQRLVDKGAARSRNGVITAALETYLGIMERQAIDEQFAAMASDESYQRLMVSLAEEFTRSNWEALSEAAHATR